MITRRTFLGVASASLACRAGSRLRTQQPLATDVLAEFGYADVELASELHEQQLRNTHAVLMGLSDDSMLKPLRAMAGQPAPGTELGGWYWYNPDYDRVKGDDGFAPACHFGQWVSALARAYAITRDPTTRDKVMRLNRLYARTISSAFYENNRFPAYCYDKLVCGLIDSHELVGDPDAMAILAHTTDTALPHLPPVAVEHGQSWRPGTDETYTWDESYTISENLFLAFRRGAGARYKQLAIQYLDDAYYDPLAEGHDDLAGRHAYSYVNSLCSAMQAYLTAGSEKHLRAARNGFAMLLAQSYATGGWGPDELLRAPGSPDLFASLSSSHASFETPCGSYAHFKLARYLLRVTRDPRYGDSMERVMYNTILGAKPLQPDGRTFYYADYNVDATKFYKPARWPCCAGTMPQVAADYRINTYFRDDTGVFVNLFVPSTLRWVQDRTRCMLTTTTTYPLASDLEFELRASQPIELSLHLRIPAWADGATIAVNGKRWGNTIPGQLASVRRTWRSGDRVELTLPMRTRLEPIDAQHPDTVALLWGPLVLFGIAARGQNVTRAQLLAARPTSATSWRAGPITLRPFFAIADEPYTTYFTVT